MSALPERMRAAVLLGAERIETREVAVPRPGPGEALVRIAAATTCGTDVKVYRRGGHPRMLRVPCLFGHEMAGHVAAVGDGIDGLAPGDPVFVANSASCGVCERCRAGRENLCAELDYLNGAFADYLHVPARFVSRSIHHLPATLPIERAPLAEPLACVLHGVDACELDSRAGPSTEVLVLGAGPIGLLFVAVLAHRGLGVMLADPHRDRLEVGARMGAAGTIELPRDHGAADVLREASRAGAGFEIAIDCTGSAEVWGAAVAAVRPGGLVNLFGGCAPGTTLTLDTRRVHYDEITVKGVYHHRPATVSAALELLARPDLDVTPLVTAEATIGEVGDALRAMIRREALKVLIGPR